MFWLYEPLALGIVRSGPAFGMVPVVPPVIEYGMDCAATVSLYWAGWCDVERLARGQFDTGHYEMQFYPVAVRVFHPEDVVLLRRKARERSGLEAVDQFFLFGLGRSVFLGETDNAAGVVVLEPTSRAVDQGDG
jgi:hypothetical protein